MEKVIQRVSVFIEALETLRKIIDLFDKYHALFIQSPTDTNEELSVALRDSMIQRFEYCTDLFWKVLKIYLENIEKISVETFSPRGVLRDAVTARLLTENEGNVSIAMIESRNRTSHIYHQEMAEIIATKVPGYYQFMKKIIDRIEHKLIV